MTDSNALTALVALLLVATGCSRPGGAGQPGPEPGASGTFRNAAGDRIGVATISDTAGTVQVGVSVAHLDPGPHGLHLHAEGTCTPPDFSSAGPHHNPEARKHGRLNPDGPHLGDLPNLIVGADGTADTSFTVATDLQPDGTALVIHAGADDERTDPSGNSGDRVACAVIEPR